MDSFRGILAFVRAAEALSFVEAGRVLGLSASAIGKSIAKLERSTGTRLFNRSTRRVSLTEEGALFFERCRQIIDELRDAEALLSRSASAPRGRLRISLPTIGYHFLLPVLPDFSTRYPDLQLDIDFSDGFVDLIDGGFDAVIRSGDLPDSSSRSRRLGSFRFVLCASPAYWARRGTPASLHDLSQHDCLAFRLHSTGKVQDWQFSEGRVFSPSTRASVLTCNNMEALHGAAVAGLGIAYMPDFLAAGPIETGALRPVLGDHLREAGQFSILWPSSRQLSPKVRAFVDFVSTRLFPADQGRSDNG